MSLEGIARPASTSTALIDKTPRNKGPRPTSGGRQQRLSPLVYCARTSNVPRLATLQGRPPGGRSDAARRAKALDSGPGGTGTFGSIKAHRALDHGCDGLADLGQTIRADMAFDLCSGRIDGRNLGAADDRGGRKPCGEMVRDGHILRPGATLRRGDHQDPKHKGGRGWADGGEKKRRAMLICAAVGVGEGQAQASALVKIWHKPGSQCPMTIRERWRKGRHRAHWAPVSGSRGHFR